LGLAALLLLYGLTAGLCAALVRPRGRRASALAILFLSALPLAYTAPGFLKRRTLAPTPVAAKVAPWADPELQRRVAAEASAPNGMLLDPLSQMVPWSRAARDDLLFNPAQGAGAALLGNGQSAVLYPTEAASRLLAPFRAVTYSQAARLLVAAWGMFLLARVAGRSELAAVVGAAVLVGSGFLQLWRLHPHSLVAATAPWILAAAVALQRRPGPRPSVLLAVAGAVGVAGGHPETLLHVMLFAALVAPALAASHPDDDDTASTAAPLAIRWRRRLGWGALSALLAFLLAAPALLPFVDALRASTEWIVRRPAGRTHVEAPLRDALERMRPAGALHALGDPLTGTWRGPENLAELGGAATGGGALLLAALALCAPGARRAQHLWIALIGAIGLAVGAHTPVVSFVFGWLPLMKDTLLKRLSLWWVLAVALLAAAAIDALRGADPRRRLAVRAAVVVAALIAFAAVARVAVLAPPADTSRIWTWEGLPVAAVALALLWWPRRGHAAAVALLVAALVAPRVTLFDGWIPVTPPEGFYVGSPAIEVLLDHLRREPRTGPRVTGIEAALVPHSGAYFGVEEIRSYDPMTFAPYERFLIAVAEPPQTSWIRVLDPRGPALDYLGVRFVLEDPAPPPSPDPGIAGFDRNVRRERRKAFRQAGLSVIYDGADGVLWERSGALPRAFVPASWRVVGSGQEALEAATTIEDFASLAVVDRAVTAPGDDTADRPVMSPRATVHELAVDRGAIAVDVETAEAALLATSQPAIPGWRLEIDQQPVRERLRRVNGAFLGVAVPGGRHRVVLRFAPVSWTLGLWLGAAGVAISALLLRRGRPRISAG
jgi:hypothetical protein